MEGNNRNAFIDDGGLSKSTSLTHLLNENENMDSDNIEVIEHSPYYSDADFQSLLKLNNTLSIMSLNSQSISAKFDEIQLFIDRINTSGSLGILCLQESWGGFLKEIAVASQRLSQPRLRLSQLRQNRSCPFLKTAKRFSKNDNSHRSVRYRSQPSHRNQTLHI